MKTQILSLACSLCAVAAAQPLTTLRVSSESAPSGGMAQMKVLLTSPMPIITGNGAWDLSQVSFTSVDGINLFSATGDVIGAAVINGSQFNLRFVSPNGTFGASVDYPIMTAAVRLSPNCFHGQVMPVNLNPFSSVWLNSGGRVQFEYQPGQITVQGSISITDVVPGGGILPPGATFSILGMGFSPKTSLSFRGLAVSSVQYVSPTEMRATAKNGGRLDGVLIQAKNPDGSSDSYYSYMRGISVGPSARLLLTKTVPIFPMNPAFEAILPPTISSQLNPSYFTAIALQNPGPVSSTVTVEAHAANGAVIASTQVALDPRYRVEREVSELLGAPLPTGGYLRMVAAQPVQMLGLLGNDTTGVVVPLAVSVISAPAVVPIGK